MQHGVHAEQKFKLSLFLFLFRGRILIQNLLKWKGHTSVDLNSSQSKTLHRGIGYRYVLSSSSLPLPCDRNGRKRLPSPRVFALKKLERSLPMSLYFRFLIARTSRCNLFLIFCDIFQFFAEQNLWGCSVLLTRTFFFLVVVFFILESRDGKLIPAEDSQN